ncbi:heavy metal translocating P-type ATPase [Candidatus Phytoplasma phoenicium]|uniref:Cation uptake P-type ATPase n=1 Tax=Candidatus Phytoplasma phoenicium TaxID=198422 RepID=A0A0L0MJ40_9MOLU|nr:heavy metal translocating P-type ATPase [Candidatus Phytoplasma phoenicium]KND62662.1 cation uptake P-type ATPase [Candidatus Phytoplasma phoenicium]
MVNCPIKYIDHNSRQQQKKFLFYGLTLYCFFLLLFLFIRFRSDVSKIPYFFIIIYTILAFVIILLFSYHVVIEGLVETYRNIKEKKKFIPNIHLLMGLGALGAVCLQEYNDAIILMMIFSFADLFEEYIENQSQKEIKKLLNIVPTQARLLKSNDEWEIIPIQQIKVGDKVIVLNGDQIPSDGIILEGASSIDESNITGESIPVDKKKGDKVFGSTINLNNNLVIEMTTTNDQAIFSKIIDLTLNIKQKIKKESLMRKIGPLYIKVILSITLIMLFIGLSATFVSSFVFVSVPFLEYFLFKALFFKSLIFLTVASPCALAVAEVPAIFAAISNLARKGMLLKSGKSLVTLSDIQVVFFDKTGTLTQGKPEVQEFFFLPEMTSEQQIFFSNVLLEMEKHSNHPLAFAIQKYLKKNYTFDTTTMTLDLNILNILGIGVEAIDAQQNQYKVAKYNIFENVTDEIRLQTDELLKKGRTVIYFSYNNKVIIIIGILDLLRPEAVKMIQYFKKNNIYTVMLTGDNAQVANEITSVLELDLCYANCLPEEKAQYIQKIKKEYGVAVMVGDGINDLPALANADVAVSLQEGSGAAIDFADIVLVKNDLQKIVYMHRISCKLKKIIWQNIIFALFVILILSILNFSPNDWLKLPWAVLIHEFSTIIVLLNCLRLYF